MGKYKLMLIQGLAKIRALEKRTEKLTKIYPQTGDAESVKT